MGKTAEDSSEGHPKKNIKIKFVQHCKGSESQNSQSLHALRWCLMMHKAAGTLHALKNVNIKLA